MAVGQNQWYHFGIGAPPILVYFSGGWDVHWGYGLLTHGHVSCFLAPHVSYLGAPCQGRLLTRAKTNHFVTRILARHTLG